MKRIFEFPSIARLTSTGTLLALAGIAFLATNPRVEGRSPDKPATAAAAKPSIVESKGCTGCHRIGGRGPTKGSDLLFASGGEWTASGFAASLWDHGPRMAEHFEKAGRTLPTFTAAEMAELFGELNRARPFSKEAAGNAKSGRLTFRNSSCSTCHDEPGEKNSSKGELDPESVSTLPHLAAGLWRSIPMMVKSQKERKRPWPHLAGHDVRNLQAFFAQPARTGASK